MRPALGCVVVSFEAGPDANARVARVAGGPASGLVNTVTSGPRSLSPLQWQDYLSRLSRMRRRVLTCARLHAQELDALGPHYVCMHTFTYAPEYAWSPRHLSEALHCYRQQARRDGLPYFRYTWVAELQMARLLRYRESVEHVLHYHLVLWCPEQYRFPKPDRRGWWKWGKTNVETARNAVGYVASYAVKLASQAELLALASRVKLPQGCRVSGMGGLSEIGRRELRWWLLPKYVRESFPEEGARIHRARGGGWVDWDTGEWVPAASRQVWASIESAAAQGQDARNLSGGTPLAGPASDGAGLAYAGGSTGDHSHPAPGNHGPLNAR